MTGSFLVETQAMAGLIRSLSTASDQITAVTNRLKSASAADLGSDDLDGAAKDFQEKWTYGIGKISDATKQITGKLQAAKSTYEQFDQQAAAALAQANGGGAQPAPSAAPAPGSGSKISNVLDGNAPVRGAR